MSIFAVANKINSYSLKTLNIMAKTTFFKKQVKNIRTEILKDIYMAIQKRKNLKIKFTETQAPRFYFDGGWRDITQLSIEFFSNASVTFGWHDDRCSGKGANAFVSSAQISTEILLQFHELIYGEEE